MKNVLLLLLALLMGSCVLFRDTLYIGMTDEEFQKNGLPYRISELTADHKVYRLSLADGVTRFVYFEQGKLVRVTEVLQPTIKVEHQYEDKQ